MDRNFGLKFLKQNDLEIHEFRGIRAKFSTLKTNQKTRVIKINFISENHDFTITAIYHYFPSYCHVFRIVPGYFSRTNFVVYNRRENGTVVVICYPL